ncbi:hypothetical protein A5N78_04555 [Prescottella equi]|nr:hypothetical protein A5N78_04555 [Prescottella equi]ORM17765.1 hypothetical protein A5N70_11130 [Prescottella equi]
MRAHSTMTRGEHRLHSALVAAMTVWLDTTRALVLGQPLPDEALLADGGPAPEPDLDAARAAFGVWERALEQHVFPVLDEAFGEAFAANQRAADISVVHWQELAMATVHDRLKIWPEGAFEELRPELLEAMVNNESIDQVQDRIGRILNIDAPARRVRAEISAIDRKLKDPTTPPGEIPILKGRRRDLWNQHDERNLEWQWLARRIARTEIHAAMEAGSLAAAQASEDITGDKMYKRWLSTHDERTRLSHAVADGQMVRLTEPFIVGGTPIQHPADPAGLAHETINCRCSLAILSWDEMQAELQGMWGGRGVGPMNARLGPDDEAAVAEAINRLERERNGEVVEAAHPAPTEEQQRAQNPMVHTDTDVDVPDADDVPVVEDDRPDAAPPRRDRRRDDDEVRPAAEDPAPDSDVEDHDEAPSDVGPDLATPEEEPPAPSDSHTPDGADTDTPEGATPELGDDATLAEQLAHDFARVLEQLDDRQREAITEWRDPGMQQRIQDVATGAVDDPEAADIVERFDSILETVTLARNVEMFTPVPNTRDVLGVTNSNIERVVGRTLKIPRYLPATTDRAAATAELPRSHRRGGPLLIAVKALAGTHIIPLPDAELLFGAGAMLLITDAYFGETAPVITAEIIL